LTSARAIASGDLAQAKLADQPAGPLLAAAQRSGQARRQQHVLLAAQLLDQMKGLEHEPDVAESSAGERARALLGDVPAGERDRAGVGPVEAAEQMQERRLATSRAAEHRDHLGGVDGEAHAVQDASSSTA